MLYGSHDRMCKNCTTCNRRFRCKNLRKKIAPGRAQVAREENLAQTRTQGLMKCAKTYEFLKRTPAQALGMDTIANAKTAFCEHV